MVVFRHFFYVVGYVVRTPGTCCSNTQVVVRLCPSRGAAASPRAIGVGAVSAHRGVFDKHVLIFEQHVLEVRKTFSGLCQCILLTFVPQT